MYFFHSPYYSSSQSCLGIKLRLLFPAPRISRKSRRNVLTPREFLLCSKKFCALESENKTYTNIKYICSSKQKTKRRYFRISRLNCTKENIFFGGEKIKLPNFFLSFSAASYLNCQWTLSLSQKWDLIHFIWSELVTSPLLFDTHWFPTGFFYTNTSEFGRKSHLRFCLIDI